MPQFLWRVNYKAKGGSNLYQMRVRAHNGDEAKRKVASHIAAGFEVIGKAERISE